MSDYIRKSALIEEMKKGQEVIKDRLDDIYVSGIYATIVAVIEEIDRQPTLDEKEIIRKPMERIIERLEDKKWGTSEWRDKWRDEIIGECIEVVKKEGGIE